jgi:uncharacterized protein YjbJ (UPF0337 family)
MKITNNKRSLLFVSVILTFCSFAAHALDTPVNKDQVEGRYEESKGKVKETTGQIINDKALESEGKNQKNLGKVQKGY